MKPYLLLLLTPLISAHMCMIWPSQRGGWNPATAPPADHKCFQPDEPCGSQPIPGATTATITGGVTTYVVFQQNLNHYNPGYPGFLDVGYAQGTNQNSDSNFTVLARFPDYWAHYERTQTNFSVPILFPNINCPWCTLRVRYNPNKPSEPVFHQCGDITINLNTNANTVFNRRVFGFFQHAPQEYEANFGEIASSGKVTPLPLSINVWKKRSQPEIKKRNTEQPNFDQFLASGVVAPTYDAALNEIFFIGDTVSTFDQGNSPNNLYRYNIDSQKFTFVGTLSPRSGRQWLSLIRKGEDGFVGVQHAQVDDTYKFIVSTISPAGVVKDIGFTELNDTYVNFFWAEYNPVTDQVHILTGDEDSVNTLNVVLYTISLTTGASSFVLIDNSQFTISEFHVNTGNGKLFAVSPGLFGEINWHLVNINPTSGAINPVGSIPNSAQFKSGYGGGVYNGLSQDGKYLMHMFTWIHTGATALAVIDTSSANLVYFTDINRGINNQRKVSGVIAL